MADVQPTTETMAQAQVLAAMIEYRKAVQLKKLQMGGIAGICSLVGTLVYGGWAGLLSVVAFSTVFGMMC